ncbi:MAG: hypothetical protein HY420_04625 [Candidatus Kerfeldbacteria bacterium]|nr:hypothetical protein [Candidatus Kerfeldbacteria bacterium]
MQMTSQFIAHTTADSHGHSNGFFHPTRFDDRAGPVGLFFLHYYPLLITIGGLMLFAILQLKTKKRIG